VTGPTAAAVAYEARWSYAALARVDRALADRFEEQRHLYWDARRSGDRVALEEQAAAMVRAYDAITQAMEAQPDDAYVVGQDPAHRAEDRYRLKSGAGNAAA
jgi:hypothetical protein